MYVDTATVVLASPALSHLFESTTEGHSHCACVLTQPPITWTSVTWGPVHRMYEMGGDNVLLTELTRSVRKRLLAEHFLLNTSPLLVYHVSHFSVPRSSVGSDQEMEKSFWSNRVRECKVQRKVKNSEHVSHTFLKEDLHLHMQWTFEWWLCCV